MVFHPETTRQALQPFDLTQAVPMTGPIAAYCFYYHLDFENDFYGLHHSCGWFHLAGYQILVHVYVPSVTKGTVWLVHGYLEHSGLYRHILPLLLNAGFAVVIYDLPGHGLSSGVRASIKSFAEYQTILDGLLTYFEDTLPRPWLGMGQSTGGAILIDHALSRSAHHRPKVFERLLLLAPLVYPSQMQWLQMQVAFWWFKAIRSGLPRAFRQNTSNADFMRFIREEDPLQARWIPLAWLLALKEWVGYIHKLPVCSMPVWVVQGELDGTVNGRYNMLFIKKNMHVARSLWLEAASHQLANERADIRMPIDHLVKQFLVNDEINNT